MLLLYWVIIGLSCLNFLGKPLKQYHSSSFFLIFLSSFVCLNLGILIYITDYSCLNLLEDALSLFNFNKFFYYHIIVILLQHIGWFIFCDYHLNSMDWKQRISFGKDLNLLRQKSDKESKVVIIPQKILRWCHLNLVIQVYSSWCNFTSIPYYLFTPCNRRHNVLGYTNFLKEIVIINNFN